MLQLIAILNLLTIIAAGAQACQAQTQLTGIIQDSFEIIIEQSEYHLTYNYPTFIFNYHPQIALSISKFQWKQFSNIKYDVNASINKHNGGLQIIFNYSEMKWRILRIDFLLFQRFNMIAGVLQFQSISEYSHSKKIMKLSNPLQDQRKNTDKILFTSILSMEARLLQVIFEINTLAEIIDQEQFSISVETGAMTDIIRVKISYLLLETQKLSLQTHYFGMVQTKFNHKQTVDKPLSEINIYPVKYSLFGVSALRILGLEESLSFSIHLSQNPTDVLRITSSSNRLDYSRIQYLFLGHNMMMTCINCPSSFIFVNNQTSSTQCIQINQCPYIPYSDTNKMHFSCRQCASNEHMKIETNENAQKFCACESGYSVDMKTGRCVETIQMNSLRQCANPFQIRSAIGKCQCMANFYRDQFGMCVGMCSADNSYWDTDYSSCRCFSGYEIKQIGKGCQLVENKCGVNQMYINQRCECDVNTVWDSENKTCIYCQPGTYKAGKNSCARCQQECLECITSNFCIKCVEGYILKQFQCLQICGDGKKMNETNDKECDDGNIINGDGCSQYCQIQPGYICEGGSKYSQDICYKPQDFVDPSMQNIAQTQKSNISDFNIKNQVSDVTYKKAEQSSEISLPQTEYSLKLNRKSLVYINSGIVADLQILPQVKRTQDQINKMFQITVSDPDSYPQTIYLSQDEQKLKNYRCYLHYNNQLPIIDFTLTIKVHFSNGITKLLSIYTNTLISEVTSAIGLNDQQSYLL